jgi:hypothetical protein
MQNKAQVSHVMHMNLLRAARITCSMIASADGSRKSGELYLRARAAAMKSRVSWIKLGLACRLLVARSGFLIAHVSAFLLAGGSPTCTAGLGHVLMPTVHT